MDRILQGQTGTINAYWERDGAAWDPGSTTVVVTNDEGVTVAHGTAVAGNTGYRTFDLPLSATSGLDYLTAAWTASDSSVLTTYAEVVSSFYFTVAQARARSPLGDTTTFPTQNILDFRTMAERALEDICGVAFTRRYSHHTATIASWGLLKVPRRLAKVVRNIYTQTDQGPVALPTLSGLRIMPSGLIFIPTFWNWWSEPITVAYEHGYDYVNPRVSRAALELARRWIVESPWDERTTAFRTRDGGEMQLLTAGTSRPGSATSGGGISNPFDIPEVVSVAEAYGMPAVV